MVWDKSTWSTTWPVTSSIRSSDVTSPPPPQGVTAVAEREDLAGAQVAREPVVDPVEGNPVRELAHREGTRAVVARIQHTVHAHGDAATVVAGHTGVLQRLTVVCGEQQLQARVARIALLACGRHAVAAARRGAVAVAAVAVDGVAVVAVLVPA